jgi:hypothetical protein
MHPKSHYHKLRNQYRPTHIELVFVLESPPASGKYFYDPEGATTEPLFSATMKIIGKNPATKDEGLTAFQAKGLLLMDATYQPVNEIKNQRKRNQAILKALPELIDDLNRTLPNRRTRLVLVKANICRLLEARLPDKGFNVLNDGTILPFPSRGHQGIFHERLQQLFKEKKIEL